MRHRIRSIALVVRAPAVAAVATVVLLVAGGTAVPAGVGGSGFPSAEPGMPASVRSWREAILPPAAYRALAGEWRVWAAEHPSSAFARVQIARALRYEGKAPPEEINALIREAVEIDPECPEALEELATSELSGPGSSAGIDSVEEAYELGLRAVRAAPDWPVPHFALWSHAVILGRTTAAQEHLRALLAKEALPAPILDFGYNLLASCPENAVLFTNGDNDTYPPLVLQAGPAIRPDVTIVNLSLLNVLQYAESVWGGPERETPLKASDIRDLHRRWEEKGGSRPGANGRFSDAVLAALFDRVRSGAWTGPVAFAITVASPVLEACPLERRLEGIVWRVLPAPAPVDDEGEPRIEAVRTLALFRDGLRTDSATDLALRWERMPAARDLMRNYPAVLRVAATERARAGDLESARWALDRAVTILRFHGEEKTAEDVRSYRESLDRARGSASSRPRP